VPAATEQQSPEPTKEEAKEIIEDCLSRHRDDAYNSYHTHSIEITNQYTRKRDNEDFTTYDVDAFVWTLFPVLDNGRLNIKSVSMSVECVKRGKKWYSEESRPLKYINQPYAPTPAEAAAIKQTMERVKAIKEQLNRKYEENAPLQNKRYDARLRNDDAEFDRISARVTALQAECDQLRRQINQELVNTFGRH